MRKLELTPELKYDIENSNMTLQQIADKYGVSYSVIYNIVKKYDLKYENKYKINTNIELIINDIVNSSMTYQQIGDKYGISKQRVNQIQHKLGLRRTYVDKLTNEMINDIENSGMSLRQIADKYYVTASTVNKLINSKGLSYEPHTSGRPKVEITQELIYDIENSNMTLQQIADKYRVSWNTLYNIIRDNNLQYKKHSKGKPKIEVTQELINDIENSDMTLQQIENKHGVSYEFIQKLINTHNLKYNKKSPGGKLNKTERTQEFIKDIEMGLMSYQEIGDKYGISRQRVHQIKQALDLDRTIRVKDKLTEEMKYDIENSNMTLQQIADKYGVSIGTVRSLIDRHNLRYEPHTRAIKVKESLIYDIENSDMKIQQIADKHGVSFGFVRKVIDKYNLKYVSKVKCTEVTQEMIQDIENGEMTLQQIGDKYGISASTVTRIIEQYKLKYNEKSSKPTIITQELIDDIKYSNMSLQKIADKHNINCATLYGICRRLNIKREGIENKARNISNNPTKELIYDIENSDMSLREIGKKYGIDCGTVRHIIIKHNLNYKNKKPGVRKSNT